MGCARLFVRAAFSTKAMFGTQMSPPPPAHLTYVADSVAMCYNRWRRTLSFFMVWCVSCVFFSINQPINRKSRTARRRTRGVILICSTAACGALAFIVCSVFFCFLGAVPFGLDSLPAVSPYTLFGLTSTTGARVWVNTTCLFGTTPLRRNIFYLYTPHQRRAIR